MRIVKLPNIKQTIHFFIISGMVYFSYKTLLFYSTTKLEGTPIPTKSKEKTTMEIQKDYLENKKKRFLNSFSKEEKDCNQNIDSCFYEKEWYQENDNEDTEDIDEQLLEKKKQMKEVWNKRIMIEHTPLGNVIMFYDVNKNGFVYYSNNTLVYYFLNALAMKYVLLFKCRDFFLDENITPTPSPLIKIMKTEEEIKNTVKCDNKMYYDSKDVFVKTKKYGMVVPTGPTGSTGKTEIKSWIEKYLWFFQSNKKEEPKKKEEELKQKEEEPKQKEPKKKEEEPKKKEEELNKKEEKYQNRFIRMGKFEEFPFLQTPIKKPIFKEMETIYDIMFNEESIQKNNYLDYKKRIQSPILINYDDLHTTLNSWYNE
jgi:hypothetical protein